MSKSVAYVFIDFGSPTRLWINRLPTSRPKGSRLLVALQEKGIPEALQANIVILRGMSARLQKQVDLSEETAAFLCTYLPYCFLSLQAGKQQRAIAIAHFAQSLDGKIATQNGHSKWIGNPENLVHAHRMRSLCDAILIGARTMNCDQPSLTVRLVAGRHPQRVVLCSSEGDFTSLQTSAGEPLLVLGTAERPCIEHAEYVQLAANQTGKINCHEILSFLYRRGLHSVYIEGGAATSSQFMQEKALDVLQLHIAPLLFGSGVSGFTLPPIEQVEQAVGFTEYAFRPMGDSYMFVGTLPAFTDD